MIIKLHEIIKFINDDLDINELLKQGQYNRIQKSIFKLVFTNVKNDFIKKQKHYKSDKNSSYNNIINLSEIYDLNDDEFDFEIIYED